MNATPHHIGCAVHHLEESAATYADAFGLTRNTHPFDVASEQVRVCFVELATGFYLELISPLDDNARLASFLRCGFYHACFLVDNLDDAREHLQAQRFLALPAFQSEAFANHRCQFFLSPQKHLIELAEISAQDFAQFFRAHLADQG